MSTYADLFVANLFHVTLYSVGREPILVNELLMRLVQQAWISAQQRYPHERIGYLFLPEQMQVLLTPKVQVTVDEIVQGMRRHFQREYHELLTMPGDLLLWQEEYEAHHILDVEELALYLDHMHYQPVQRGFVDRPEEWPYSSFTLWQERGIYPPRWGAGSQERTD